MPTPATQFLDQRLDNPFPGIAALERTLGRPISSRLGGNEALALARLGANPQVTEASGMRFISYSDQADTRSAVVSAASGRVLSQSGAYTSCDVSFLTVPDKTQAWRVADIRIRSEGPAGGMCRSLLNTPED